MVGDERQAVFEELLQYSNDQGYFVPLYVPMNNFAADPALHFSPRADGLYEFSETSCE